MPSQFPHFLCRAAVALLISVALINKSASAQGPICPDKKTACQSNEICVTWERGCSMGSNCLQPGFSEKFNDCVKPPVHPVTLSPSKQLCSSTEVFARSLDKSCPKSPCPLRLGYTCYPSTGVQGPSCSGRKCPFGMACLIGEHCNDVLCEPQPICKLLI